MTPWRGEKAVFGRLINAIDKAARGLVYLSVLAIASALALTAAIVVIIGCARTFEFLWKTILGHPWG